MLNLAFSSFVQRREAHRWCRFRKRLATDAIRSALSGTAYRVCPIVAALLGLLTACGSGNKTVLEEVVEKVYAVEPEPKVSIQNGEGAVSVYGSDKNELRVECVKKAYSQERLNQIAIDVSTAPGAASVVTKFPRQPKWAFWDRSGTVDCTIVIPAATSVSTLVVSAGEVLLDSMHGSEVHARLNDGRIFVRNCFTNLILDVNRGTLALSYGWWEEKNFSAQVSMNQGNVSVWLPSDAAFHLFAEAGHGKIANDFNNVPITANVSGGGMKVDQMVNGGDSTTIRIKLGKGDVKIGEANP